MKNYQVIWLSVSGSMFAVLGCGGATDLKLPDPVPVKGTVLIDQQPLTNALVSFIPEGTQQMGQGANAITDASGTFELVTARGSSSKPGAIAGNYKVIISRLIGPDGSPIAPVADKPPADLAARESLPPRYSDVMMSELKASVSEQGGSFDFQVMSR